MVHIYILKEGERERNNFSITVNAGTVMTGQDRYER